MECFGNMAEAKTLLDKNMDTNYTENPVYLRDGKRQCDYVLCYQTGHEDEAENALLRKNFEKNLRKEGLELEYGSSHDQVDGGTNESALTLESIKFVHIHAPWEVLCKWAEITRLRKPIAKNDLCDKKISGADWQIPILGPLWNKVNAPPHPTEHKYEFITHENDMCYFTAPFDRARADNFIIKDKNKFFKTAERQRIVLNIINRTHFGDSHLEVGINRLIKNEVYLSMFPLHEGKWQLPHQDKNADQVTGSELNKRQTLYWTWGRPGMWRRPQPLELIRQYFGEKIGMYFAWLGFYTLMLIPVSIFGIIVFIYGIVKSYGDSINVQTCSSNLTMCPRCDDCPFWKLNDSCTYTEISRVFDNELTIFFALVMSLWATFFLEFWKRKRATLVHKWDLHNFEEEEEQIRPEYESACKKHKVNPVTGAKEPHMPFYQRVPRIMGSFSMFLVLLVLVVGAVVGVILYRITVGSVLRAFSASSVVQNNSSLITSLTAATLSFIVITIFNIIYQKIAESLTNLEAPRTATDFEDSYTLKMFLFQAVNYYSSLVYIAFFKGKLNGDPYEYKRMFGYRGEECDPSGCLIELCIQLGIIMILKQALNNTKEIVLPLIKNWFKQRQLTKGNIIKLEEGELFDQYHRDFALEDPGQHWLFSEYLEMVIQFGFITLFVASFPLAPFFALLNNIIEIRLDAYKFTTQIRRLPARRCENIGMWYPILQGISTLSVITNGIVITFTSEFIPRSLYLYSYGPCAGNSTQTTGCMDGYVDATMAEIPVERIDRSSEFSSYNSSDPNTPDTCWFRASSAHLPVQPGLPYWNVLAIRVVFLILFEHLVFGLKVLFDLIIPDVPKKLKLEADRQNFLELKIMYEKTSARELSHDNNKELDKEYNNVESVTKDEAIEMQDVHSGENDTNMYPKLS